MAEYFLFSIPILNKIAYILLSAANTVGTTTGGSAYRNGTCLTSPECTQKGGESSGSCAGG